MAKFPQNVGVVQCLALVLLLECIPPNLSSLENSTKLPPSSNMQQNNTNHVVLIKDMLYIPGYIWANPELCPKQGADIKLLILIMSAPNNNIRRASIRETWGKFAKNRDDVTIAFFLGRSSIDIDNITIPYAVTIVTYAIMSVVRLSAEDALHRDTIMGKFWDSYRNQTQKVLSMLEWTAEYCQQAQRVLKTDDDMFINVPLLLVFIANTKHVNATKTIWGKVFGNDITDRDPTSKYYLSSEQYPPDFLPEYATGPAYLMTSDAVLPLLAARAAPAVATQPFIFLEDVFITGILAAEARVRKEHAELFYNEKVKQELCTVQRRISIHDVKPDEQSKLWSMVMSPQVQCKDAEDVA